MQNKLLKQIRNLLLAILALGTFGIYVQFAIETNQKAIYRNNQ